MKSYGLPEPKEADEIGRADYPMEGMLNLLAAIIRDGLLADPYWFMSPRARQLCDIGNLRNIKLMYEASLDKNPHKDRIPYQALSEDDYLAFRKEQRRKERAETFEKKRASTMQDLLVKDTEHEVKIQSEDSVARPRRNGPKRQTGTRQGRRFKTKL